MRKALFLLSILTLLLFGCSSNETKKSIEVNWSAYSKNTFMQKCNEQVKTKMDTSNVDTYCNCIMEKMIAAYPDTSVLDKMGPEKIKSESMSMAIKCLF